MTPLPRLPRSPRLAAFVFAATMTLAMLSGIGALAGSPVVTPALAAAAPAHA